MAIGIFRARPLSLPLSFSRAEQPTSAPVQEVRKNSQVLDFQ
jgi:hypothetical protein